MLLVPATLLVLLLLCLNVLGDGLRDALDPREPEAQRRGGAARSSGLGVDFRTPAGAVRAVAGARPGASRAGECLGVVGESGAGKSQVFLAVMGLLAANGAAHGSARFLGRELLTLPPAAARPGARRAASAWCSRTR